MLDCRCVKDSWAAWIKGVCTHLATARVKPAFDDDGLGSLLGSEKVTPGVTPTQKRKRPASLQALIYMVPAPGVEPGTY